MEFLQFLEPLPMIIQLGVPFWYPITCTQNGTSSPLLLKKNPNKNNKSSVIHIFFSYLFIKNLENSHSRTVGTEAPKRRYRSPERSLIPTPETSRSRIVGLPM